MKPRLLSHERGEYLLRIAAERLHGTSAAGLRQAVPDCNLSAETNQSQMHEGSRDPERTSIKSSFSSFPSISILLGFLGS